MHYLLTKMKRNWMETTTTAAMQHRFTRFESTLNKVKNAKLISVWMIKTHWYRIWYILQY